MSTFETTNFRMLLFSKYSENSKKILALIKDNNNLFNTLNINVVCIDNENIRKRILNSDIEINVVPCLLSIKDKIQIEKFEGQELNNWIYYQIQQQQQKQILQQQQIMQQQQQIMQQQHHVQQQQQQDIIIPSSEQQIPIASEVESSTPIDDLLLLDNEEDIDVVEHENNNIEELTEIAVQEITKKPRKKENKYSNSQSHDYNEYEIKNKKKDQKKLDLLNAAMMMKKSREDEDKNINKNFVTI